MRVATRSHVSFILSIIIIAIVVATFLFVIKLSNTINSEETFIKQHIKTQLNSIVTIPYEIDNVKVYSDTWAKVRIISPNTDPATVILKKENGVWKQVLGPGTYLDEASLERINAPAEVKNDSNNNNY